MNPFEEKSYQAMHDIKISGLKPLIIKLTSKKS